MAESLLLASFFQPMPVTPTNTLRFSLIAQSALIRLSFCHAVISPELTLAVGGSVGTDELEPSVPAERAGGRSVGRDSSEPADIPLAGGRADGSPLPAVLEVDLGIVVLLENVDLLDNALVLINIDRTISGFCGDEEIQQIEEDVVVIEGNSSPTGILNVRPCISRLIDGP